MVKISVKLLSIIATVSLVKGAQIYSCTVPNTVALTFDDGPTQYTSKLVDTLDKYGVKATFFINAHNYSPYADESAEARAVIKKAYQSGHQIASHTYNHLIESDTTEFKKSLSKMDKFVKNIIGVTPRYFRAPGGNCGDSCVKLLEDLGYRIIKWDVDTIDWKSRSFSSSSSIIKEFANQKNKNYLVLMHDSMEHSVKETVPWILSSGVFKGYKFVTVADCLGEKSKMYRESSSSSSSSSSDSSSSNEKQASTVAASKATNAKQRTVTKVQTAVATNSPVAYSPQANPDLTNTATPDLTNSGVVDPTLNSTDVQPVNDPTSNIVTDNPNISLTSNTSGCMSKAIPNLFMIMALSVLLIFNGF